MPARLPERGVRLVQLAVARHICEIRVTDFGADIPAPHGVDRLRKLRAARLVDTAGVDPSPSIPVLPSYFAALADLLADVVN